MAEHPKVREGKNPNQTPIGELTEKDLLLGIYRAVSTIRTIVMVCFVLGLLFGVLVVASASGGS